MDWKKYRIRELGPDALQRTDVVVVEAPSPGVAIEYFLATHGMLRYDRIVLAAVNETADKSRVDVLRIMPDAEKRVALLDKWHTWEEERDE